MSSSTTSTSATGGGSGEGGHSHQARGHANKKRRNGASEDLVVYQGDQDNNNDVVRPLSSTCNSCRERKVKCTGLQPCIHCVKAGIECVFRNRLKPGLKAGSGEAMMKRLVLLEGRLEEVADLRSRVADLESWKSAYDPGSSIGSTSTSASASTSGPRSSSVSQATPLLPPTPLGSHGSTSTSILFNEPRRQSVASTPSQSTFDFGGSSSVPIKQEIGTSFSFLTRSQGQLPPVPGSASTTNVYPTANPYMSATSLPQMLPPPFPPASMSSSTSTFGGAAQGGPYLPPLRQSPGMPTTSPAPTSTGSFVDPGQLPSDDMVRDLVRLYFKNISPWAPILLETMPQLWNPPWPATVYAMVAVSLRFSTHPDIKANEERLHTSAKQHVILHAVESTSISSLQALVIIVLDLIGRGTSPASWGLLALLTRSIVHLGLSKEEADTDPAKVSKLCVLPPSATPQEEETRRRLFWAIYMLDRYACAATGWDFAVSDHDIQRRVPCKDALWRNGAETPFFTSPLGRRTSLKPHEQESVSPFAYLVDLLDILGRAHNLHTATSHAAPQDIGSLKERTRELVRVLHQAFQAMPNYITYLPEGMASSARALILAIHTTYHATVLKLCARFAYPMDASVVVEPFASECLRSTNEMGHIARIIMNSGLASEMSPFVVWSIWVSARVGFVHAYTTKCAPQDHFFSLITCLKELSRYWTLATQYTSLLEKALTRWQNQTSASGNSQESLSQAIAVLLDMRKTAYTAVASGDTATPPDEISNTLSGDLPSWAAQPLLGDLYQWFDTPPNGIFMPNYGLSSM